MIITNKNIDNINQNFLNDSWVIEEVLKIVFFCVIVESKLKFSSNIQFIVKKLELKIEVQYIT